MTDPCCPLEPVPIQAYNANFYHRCRGPWSNLCVSYLFFSFLFGVSVSLNLDLDNWTELVTGKSQKFSVFAFLGLGL